MNTREQLEDHISNEVRNSASGDYGWEDIQKTINIVVSACEEVVIETDEGYQSEELGSVIQIDILLENLKKLKFV